MLLQSRKEDLEPQKYAYSCEGKALRRALAADITVDQSHDQSHVQKETPTHGIQQSPLHPSDVVSSPLYHQGQLLLKGGKQTLESVIFPW